MSHHTEHAMGKQSYPPAVYSSIHPIDGAVASNSNNSATTVAGSLKPDMEHKTAHDNVPKRTSLELSKGIPRLMASNEHISIAPSSLSSEHSLSSSQESTAITIEDSKSPSYNKKSYPQNPSSDCKVPTSRTFSIPLGPPPSYDSFSSTISSKLRLRPLKATKSSKKQTTWGIHWWMPSCMLVGILAGLLTAVGHHIYNTRLHGHEVSDPTWPQRFGSAFSFLVKFCLVGSVEIAYKQRVWVSDKISMLLKYHKCYYTSLHLEDDCQEKRF